MENNKESELLEKRKKKFKELRSSNLNLFPNDFKVTHAVLDIRNFLEESPDFLTEETPVFALAGRLMAINKFGKAAFIRFNDRTGQIQAYVRRDKVGEKSYSNFKMFDIGDFVGIKGGLFKTSTGEWTILASEIRLLTKSVKPLPEKYHGLKDPEKRYRQRYIDLIINPWVREIFVRRSNTIRAIRKFLLERDFLEVETPMMQPIPGGAEAEPFTTYHNALGMNLYLRIAPELYLKRLVVGGLERVFEINRNFRNEGVSTQHNPEFTMLEFYQAYATYKDLMDLTEQMLRDTAKEVAGSEIINYQGNIIDLGKKFEKIELMTVLETIGGINPELIKDKEKLLKFASEKGIIIKKTGRLGKVITKLFDI